jgi:hypothetical protein
MEFSNTANGQGIIQDVDFLCGTNSTSYPTVDKVRNINQAYHDVTRLIWECSDAWQYDDSNKTDLPVALAIMVDGQQDYELPTDAQKARRVEVKDVNGNWVRLAQIDYKDVDVALPEFQKESGLPAFYDILGRSVLLYPPPSEDFCSLDDGLAVYVDRDVTLFTSASTTDAPGFAPQFHRILSLEAALDFEKDSNQRNLWLIEKTNLTEGLKRFYGSRSVERRTEITPANKKNYRQYE